MILTLRPGIIMMILSIDWKIIAAIAIAGL